VYKRQAQTASATIDTTNLTANIYDNTVPTGGVTPTDDTWQTYTYTFTATSSTTAITFLLRNDPSYFYLDKVSVKLQGDTTELLANGGFEGGSPAAATIPPPIGLYRGTCWERRG